MKHSPALALAASLAASLLGCSSPGSSPAAPSSGASGAVPPAASSSPKGRVVQEHFSSAALGVDKRVVVYLPAGYDAATAKRWPVFYYLHGLGGQETSWVKGGGIDRAADALGLQAIIVMPDGDDGFYANSAAPAPDYDACVASGAGLYEPESARNNNCVRKRDYETYVVQDLIPWVDRTYRTLAVREGRAVAGLSMGGFGALHLAMRHRDLFAAAASHSGVDSLLYAGPFPYAKGKVQLTSDVAGWGGSLGPIGAWMRGIFGASVATWRGYDPTSLAAQLAPGELALYLDCGSEDELALHNGMQYLHDLLTERGIAHEYYLGPGRHNFAFWTARVPKSLAFLAGKTQRAQ